MNFDYEHITKAELPLHEAEIIFEALEHIVDVITDANNQHYARIFGRSVTLLSDAPFTRALVDTLRIHMLRMDTASRLKTHPELHTCRRKYGS